MVYMAIKQRVPLPNLSTDDAVLLVGCVLRGQQRCLVTVRHAIVGTDLCYPAAAGDAPAFRRASPSGLHCAIAVQVRRGLGDRAPAVRAEVAKLVMQWLEDSCEGEPLRLVHQLDVQRHPGGWAE